MFPLFLSRFPPVMIVVVPILIVIENVSPVMIAVFMLVFVVIVLVVIVFVFVVIVVSRHRQTGQCQRHCHSECCQPHASHKLLPLGAVV